VDLTSFSATEDAGKVNLVWETASEENCQMFYVEKNGEPFTQLAGAGTTSGLSHYSVVDSTVVDGETYTYTLSAVSTADESLELDTVNVTLVSILGNEIIDSFELFANYPNPFNPVTTIEYQLPENSEIRLKVFDLSGNLIQTLVSEHQTSGYYTVFFNAVDLSSGMYLYQLHAGNEVITKKMLLLK
jgi:hypothetical protein